EPPPHGAAFFGCVPVVPESAPNLSPSFIAKTVPCRAMDVFAAFVIRRSGGTGPAECPGRRAHRSTNEDRRAPRPPTRARCRAFRGIAPPPSVRLRPCGRDELRPRRR